MHTYVCIYSHIYTHTHTRADELTPFLTIIKSAGVPKTTRLFSIDLWLRVKGLGLGV